MPNLYVIGGPNGAGKTTIALRLLPGFTQCNEFVNADFIAKGLSAFNTESVAFASGRLMLQRLNELKAQQKDFAFETTLSSKSFAPFLNNCKSSGYIITLIYVWIENSEIAVERVRKRFADGGHSIPDDAVRRRYERSIANLKSIYLPLVDAWEIYDNTQNETRLMVKKGENKPEEIFDKHKIETIMKHVVGEQKIEYTAGIIERGVKTAIAEELERKRKLGLPMVFGIDGKVVVMIGDTVVEERPYSVEKNVTRS